MDELARDGRLAPYGHVAAVGAARNALERARAEIRAGAEPTDPIVVALEELTAAGRPRLRRVLNATGIVVHTNLGRAPLAAAAL